MNTYDIVGVGLGPFNLSLAALIEGGDKDHHIKSIFLEKKEKFEWHGGMLIEGTTMQTHFLKDLVTPVDPSNMFSFLSYLKHKNLFYHFLHRKKWYVSRVEFNDYMKWCASRLGNLKFYSEVTKLEFDKNLFKIYTNEEKFFSKHIVLGTGIEPNIPPNINIDNRCFHTSDYLNFRDQINFDNKRITVIGGSQSGAEIVKDILKKFPKILGLCWIEKNRFCTLQESCFDNELYSPHYPLSIHGFQQQERFYQNNTYYSTSNGITSELADEIYHIIYDKKFLDGNSTKIDLLPHRDVNSIKRKDDFYLIESSNRHSDKKFFTEADVVILATGYKSNHFSLLKNLFPDIKNIEEFIMNNDYSIKWNNTENKIFIQNGLESHFGVPDSNISLAAWRSGRILDCIMNKPFEEIQEEIIAFRNHNKE